MPTHEKHHRGKDKGKMRKDYHDEATTHMMPGMPRHNGLKPKSKSRGKGKRK